MVPSLLWSNAPSTAASRFLRAARSASSAATEPVTPTTCCNHLTVRAGWRVGSQDMEPNKGYVIGGGDRERERERRKRQRRELSVVAHRCHRHPMIRGTEIIREREERVEKEERERKGGREGEREGGGRRGTQKKKRKKRGKNSRRRGCLGAPSSRT